MKKSLIALGVVAITLLQFSCTSGKRCRGGGWYGKRNLSSIEKQQPAAQQQTLAVELNQEESCDSK